MDKKRVIITEELYEQILDELRDTQGYRNNDDSVHADDVWTDTACLLEQAYDEGIYTDIEEAYKRLAKGETPGWSTGICECVTVGYGKLDESGYWEFPLVIDEETNDIMPWEVYVGEDL